MKKSVIGMSVLAVIAAVGVGLAGCEKKQSATTKKTTETKTETKGTNPPPAEKP